MLTGTSRSSYMKRKKRLEILSLWASQEWGFRAGQKQELRKKVIEIKAVQRNSVSLAMWWECQCGSKVYLKVYLS